MDCIINEKGALIIMRGEADIERVQYCRYVDNVCGDWCPHFLEKQKLVTLHGPVSPGTFKKRITYHKRNIVNTCAGHEMDLIEDRRK